MNYKKLGDYIKLVYLRNNDNIDTVKGVSSITKNLMETKANLKNVDLSVYKVVQKYQFTFNPNTARMGDRIPVALNLGKACVVSPIYPVFEIVNTNELLPEYLLMWFKRSDFDRYARFHSWGSARETFNWEDFCDIELPIPDIEIQKNVVAVYIELLRNQKSYEGSLDDLQLICDTFIQGLIKSNDLKTLGSYIKQSEHENYGLPLSKVRGVSIHKVLIKPKANMTDVELSGYKLLKIGQFVFNPNTARMGERIPIALNTEEDFIVSKIYPVFEITKTEELLPEFLYLWFTRPDFDRYARFHSWGSARETFNWEDMCAVKLPVPDIEIQKSIVSIHHVMESRKKINADLKNMISPLCPVLIKGVIDDLQKIAIGTN
ncbi:MAG: restriction endonuclease subunit S [Ignavibacteriaceae bacterium]|nr:restriction endonuclease subunit S [Ignavibacteriaceae bacterium]